MKHRTQTFTIEYNEYETNDIVVSIHPVNGLILGGGENRSLFVVNDFKGPSNSAQSGFVGLKGILWRVEGDTIRLATSEEISQGYASPWEGPII